MNPLDIRSATQAEFAIAVDWAKAEGWNPGIDDLEAFFPADPNGFLMGFLDGKPVSSISVVRYGEDYGFLGFYIVHPDHRSTGVGIATWNAGMAYLEGRTVGLDGVVDQQDNYRKSGFAYAGRNVRFAGTLASNLPGAVEHGITVEAMAPSHFEAVISYDKPFFPADRRAFMRAWTLPDDGVRRNSWVALEGNAITGFVTVRSCVEGYKIGPLFADNKTIARSLLRTVAHSVTPGTTIILDVPEANEAAVSLAREWGLEPIFETARMYKGKAPDLPEKRIFGITTFELG